MLVKRISPAICYRAHHVYGGELPHFLKDNATFAEAKIKEVAMVKKYKSGGEIRTPKNFKQNEQEQGKNIKADSSLAKEYGLKYELLSVKNEHGVKNPDALNVVTNKLSDAKMPITGNGKNAIQNSIKEAARQLVSEVFIYAEVEYRMQDIWSGLKAALQKGRAKSIETIIIRLKSGDLKKYEVAKLRKIFKGKGETT
jgi:hypothetical protein